MSPFLFNGSIQKNLYDSIVPVYRFEKIMPIYLINYLIKSYYRISKLS